MAPGQPSNLPSSYGMQHQQPNQLQPSQTMYPGQQLQQQQQQAMMSQQQAVMSSHQPMMTSQHQSMMSSTASSVAQQQQQQQLIMTVAGSSTSGGQPAMGSGMVSRNSISIHLLESYKLGTVH